MLMMEMGSKPKNLCLARLLGCTSAPRTLGKELPATRSTKERAHQWMAEVGGEIRCRVQRDGSWGCKTERKRTMSSRGLYEQKESKIGRLERRLTVGERRQHKTSMACKNGEEKRFLSTTGILFIGEGACDVVTPTFYKNKISPT
jgi:hypothetical protein